VPEHEQARVRQKRLLADRKTALAVSLLQRYYIHIATGEKWDNVQIGRTLHGKPFHSGLDYNVSKANGVVVLVGYSEAIGIDIIARDTNQFKSSHLRGLFSPRELNLADGHELLVNDRHLLGWAYKEAYMKFTGIPDWDRITSFEFLEVKVPQTGELVKDCVVCVEGTKHECYTELHNFEDTHFIAVYTATAPNASEDEGFRRLTLQEITPTTQEI